MAAQQGGTAGVSGLEMAAGIVAAGGDYGIDRRGAVVEFDGDMRIDRTQRLHDILHQYGVFARGLDDAAMPCRYHA